MPFGKNKGLNQSDKKQENTREPHYSYTKHNYKTKGGFGQYSMSGRKKGCGCG